MKKARRNGITFEEDAGEYVPLENVFDAVRKERIRQDAKWGEQNHAPMEWLPILMEEVGEASKEALELYFMIDTPGGNAERVARYRNEMVQVAAVAISMIECLDRNDGPCGTAKGGTGK